MLIRLSCVNELEHIGDRVNAPASRGGAVRRKPTYTDENPVAVQAERR